MRGHVYVVQGDITKCQADAIAFSTSADIDGTGKLYPSFAELEGFDAAYRAMGQLERRWAVGDTHWVPRTRDRPGVVICVTVGGVGTWDDPIERGMAIVRSTLLCATNHLREQDPTARLLILLPTFLTGAGGGHQMRADLARAQLRSAADTIADLPGVDVAFVLFHPADHDVYRIARRAVMPTLFDGLRAPDARLVDAVRRGECALFVGSGLSAGARMRNWWELIEHLRGSVADLEPTPSDSALEHLRVAQTYRDQTHARALTPVREVVREMFGAKNRTLPTLAHYLLVGLGTRNVITTNYDHLLEHSLAACRHAWRRVTEAAEVPQTAGLGSVNVIKFHGDAEQGKDVVVSQADYDNFFTARPAFDLLLSGLLLNQSFLFLGYSLRDPNFKQIYNRIASVLGAARLPTFATSFESGPDQDQDLAHVEVVPFTGSRTEQTQLHLRWLDQLSDDAIRPESVLLARAADGEHVATARMMPVRKRMLELGNDVLRLAKEDLTPHEARTLAHIARTLFAHGWQADSGNDRVLGQLAARLERTEDREALLVAALAQTDSQGSVAELERLLRALTTD